MRAHISTVWQRFLLIVGIVFALIVGVELIGALLLLFGQPTLYCTLERCYP